MKIETTGFEGLVVYTPKIYEDSRGQFTESFNLKTFSETFGHEPHFVQDNESVSSYGVIRALHSQQGERAQAKLVRVVSGRVLDVVVDIRRDQPTFGKHFAIELSAQNNMHMYIPRGFLHGFSVLSPSARFLYKCDNYFEPMSEVAVAYDDEFLGIDWKIPEQDVILSAKDSNNASFEEAIRK